jgi:L-cystine uptake protein TcyP (sodium:dicarboxylate symporter family)
MELLEVEHMKMMEKKSLLPKRKRRELRKQLKTTLQALVVEVVQLIFKLTPPTVKLTKTSSEPQLDESHCSFFKSRLSQAN